MVESAVRQLLANMGGVESAPVLRTLNGFGFRLSGSLILPGIKDAYVSVYWFVALFMPLVPIRVYIVSQSSSGQYKFHGILKFSAVHQAYGNRVWWLLASAWLQGLATLAVLFFLIELVSLIFSGYRRRY